jgi:hypothetical protein
VLSSNRLACKQESNYNGWSPKPVVQLSFRLPASTYLPTDWQLNRKVTITDRSPKLEIFRLSFMTKFARDELFEGWTFTAIFDMILRSTRVEIFGRYLDPAIAQRLVTIPK